MNFTDIETKVSTEIEALAACKISDLDAEIFKSGLLDSLNILNIIVFIENEFGFKINPFDINLETLGSINRICDFIRSKKTA
jgi:D-alanine--poly(phosphoribitol) ligase subunit 2